MTVVSQPFPGAFLLQPKAFEDARGEFVKTFHEGVFRELGIAFCPVEEFFSTSRRGVLRGMHFQLPPHDHAKLVYCVRGRVLDVLLDLRKGSPSFGRSVAAELSRENRRMFFIPSGIAHGFLSLEDESLMIYKTSSVHAPAHDAGVRWDSFGFDWGLPAAPIMSARDAALPPFASFANPF